MNRILLIYENYTELNTVEVTLKKVGFDCIGITTEFSISDQIISFNPDIVIACGKGPKVSTVSAGRRLKEMSRWPGRVVLIFTPGLKPKPEDLIKIRMDVVLEAPIPTVRLVQVLAKMTNQDDQVLLEKLVKPVTQEESMEGMFISGAPPEEKEEVFIVSGNQDPDEDAGQKFSADLEREQDAFTSSNEPQKSEKKKVLFDLTPQDAEKEVVTVEREKVDWNELEKQLLSSPEEVFENKDLPINLTPEATEAESVTLSSDKDKSSEEKILDPHQQLLEAQAHLNEKMQKYQDLTKDIKLHSESTLKRTAVREAQKKLKEDWGESELQSQDELRREFTKALFKKK